MKNIRLFNVSPSVPEAIGFLETLSRNLWWCWHPDAIELFRRIHPQLWRETGHNPLEFLSRTPQKRLETLASDEAFLRHLGQVQERFVSEVEGGAGAADGACIAYVSLEYGTHESVRLYSGGLGILAGDHLKASSDLGLPMVAVGLMYRRGYFQQYLNNEGWQQEHYLENEIHRLPVQPARDAAGTQARVVLPLPEGTLHAAVWRLDVGRVPLYLLDANLPENPADFRNVTAQLYDGDRKNRLRQELLLGIGGFRALVALGHDPHVCHMNEGHAAFTSLGFMEHMAKRDGLDSDTVLEIVPRTSVFTTHTPVPAGNEAFPVDLVKPHLQALESDMPLHPDRIMQMAQQHGHKEFSMTVLGLHMSAHNNGVSDLHGRVTRKMWSGLWPEFPEEEIPIGHITNGIHVPSWLSPDNGALYDRYLGENWRGHPAVGNILSHVAQIPDEELWRAHELGRSRLIRTVRERSEQQLRARNATRTQVAEARTVLDHDALTIGFARRFASYKRATLLLQDPDRFEALLGDGDRPVQFIFAGKAHPADNEGKDLIRQMVQFSRRANVSRHVVFLENYDMNIARNLVQGVDVWLNTPRRPREASGTSGMKAAVNGGINLSVLDGWWCEGYSPECGWAIGRGEEYEDVHYQDAVESQALYNLLEDEVIPRFYDRNIGDIPRAWIKMMKASIRMSLGFFSSHRMAAEYKTLFYDPARQAYDRLTADGAAEARNLLVQRKRLQALWQNVGIELPSLDEEISVLHVGDRFHVTSSVRLGDLKPEEVNVQVYYGPVDSENRITKGHVETMGMTEDRGGGAYVYGHEIVCKVSGRYGFTTRVIPGGEDWKAALPGFITWADGT